MGYEVSEIRNAGSVGSTAPSANKGFQGRLLREENAATLNLGPEFEDPEREIFAVSIAEARLLIDVKKNDMDLDQDDFTTTFKKTEMYVEKFDRFGSKDMVETVINAMSKHIAKYNFHEFEAAQLMNLLPDDAEEAKAIIPSLREKVDSDVLNAILQELKDLTM